MATNRYLERTGPAQFSVKNPYGIPITLFANEEVPIENDAIEQLLSVAQTQETIEKIGNPDAKINRIVLTPDFHRGENIPIGTVIETEGFFLPQAPGNDICCGMRLIVTDITRDELEPHLDKLMNVLRSIFFEGKREILMSPRQREALLREGLWGLLETNSDNAGKGIWKYYDRTTQTSDLMKVHFQGMLPTKDIFSFKDYIRQSGAVDARDSALGSVGAGNHFNEIQYVDDVLDGTVAHEWGLKKGLVTIMVHTGSLGLGHAVGHYFKDQAIKAYPKRVKRPTNGFFPVFSPSPLAVDYLDAMNNAANFAFGNRLFLGLMAVRAMSEVVGRHINSKLVYDAPHNLIWEEKTFIHRKGACPAPGMTDRFPNGTPVIIPGSMGSASYVLAGKGNSDALSSACHGAGRLISRNKARVKPNMEMLNKLRVVTPIDPNSFQARARTDVMTEYVNRLAEEAPTSYKDITPIIQSVDEAEIAAPVAKLHPILTVKG